MELLSTQQIGLKLVSQKGIISFPKKSSITIELINSCRDHWQAKPFTKAWLTSSHFAVTVNLLGQ